jgi:hypothetical protein
MNEDEAFKVLQDVIDNPRNIWPAAYTEARQKLNLDPRVRDVVEYGFAAWEQLTPAQRHYALDDLFQAYFWRVYTRERDERLAEQSKEEFTNLQSGDVFWVEDALSAEGVDVKDEDCIVTGVLAGPLHRLLLEFELLQFRLLMHGGAADE